MESANKCRHYLISIQQNRSIVSLIACVATVICSGGALGANLVLYVRSGWAISDFFSYFTNLSNILITLAGSFIVPYSVNGIRNKRFVLPRWLSMMHYSGIICICLVHIFTLVFILPYNRDFAVGGPGIFLHVISPLAIVISYFMVESHYDYSVKEVHLCMLPFFVYSLVYFVMVVIIGPENGGWEDLYMLNTYVPAYFSMPFMYLITFSLAMIIRKLSDALYKWRMNRMISSWNKDMDVVEIQVEVYGLGRYYGLNGDMNNLTVPFDILEFLAKHYNMDIKKMYAAYTKGLYNGIIERNEDAF